MVPSFRSCYSPSTIPQSSMKCGARSLWWQVPEYENRPVECVQARARARRRRRCGFVCWLSSCLALVSHLSRELSRRCLFKRELCGAIVPTGMCDFVRKCKSTSNELCGFDKRSAASVVRERPVLTTSMNPRHMTTSPHISKSDASTSRRANSSSLLSSHQAREGRPSWAWHGPFARNHIATLRCGARHPLEILYDSSVQTTRVERLR